MKNATTENAVHTKTVSENALFKRCARKMSKEGVNLHRNSNARYEVDLGWYYTTSGDRVVSRHSDLELLAADLGCLRDGEKLVR